jgi:Zn-dependent M28 family amino/carboxypeptidase
MSTVRERSPQGRLIRFLTTLVLVAGVAGSPAHLSARQASPTATPAKVDVGALMSDVRTLSGPDFDGRRTGSDGNHLAQAYVLRRFKEIGLETVGGTYQQKFSFTPRARGSSGAAAKSGQMQGTNLFGMIRGTSLPEEFVVVSAHYDHLGRRDGSMYPGADDNASGVAGILAVATWFVRHRPDRSLLVVAFDAEELGLQGARYFVKNSPVDLKGIKTVVNLDMISRGDANTLWAAGTSYYPALKDPVVEAARDRTIKVEFGHDRPKAESKGLEDWTNSSDHGPFHAAGIPFLYFGVEDHPDYHKPTDTADKIPQTFFAEAAALAIDVVARVSTKPSV